MSPSKRFSDRDDVVAVRAEAERLQAGQEAEAKRRLAGRVLARRDMGKSPQKVGASCRDFLRIGSGLS